jgi:uncharacterized protein involved in exopolysaccharide biosynthesis
MTRQDIEAANKQLRQQCYACTQQIKDYQQRIEANRAVLIHLKNQINANTEKFIELGKAARKGGT